MREPLGRKERTVRWHCYLNWHLDWNRYYLIEMNTLGQRMPMACHVPMDTVLYFVLCRYLQHLCRSVPLQQTGPVVVDSHENEGNGTHGAQNAPLEPITKGVDYCYLQEQSKEPMCPCCYSGYYCTVRLVTRELSQACPAPGVDVPRDRIEDRGSRGEGGPTIPVTP